ncbi:MAG: hypothetical protein L3J33_09105 [Rhodobacteraceae bacterium]|nr:hypothetical protein [Paracoccaceae bacterium]
MGISKISIVSAFLLLTAGALFGATEKNDVAVQNLFSDRQFREYSDEGPVYLEQFESLFSAWNRVAVLYGYVDNYSACDEWKIWLSSGYPNVQFRCIPVAE